jgi:heat shock protein HspQ
VTSNPKFFVGQIVHHSRFNYRGVVVDVDADFQGSEAWYEQVARSRPPKDAPWYRILVDGGENQTYVAELHLEVAPDRTPVSHPDIPNMFSGYKDGAYQHRTH